LKPAPDTAPEPTRYNRSMVWKLTAIILLAATALFSQTPPNTDPPRAQSWYEQWPVLPDGLRAKSPDRAHPPIVNPGATDREPPADAIILFDGADTSKWFTKGKRKDRGQTFPFRWKLGDGYMEVVPLAGDLVTHEKFGSIQLHVEWASPTEIDSGGQGRGNSGITPMGVGKYEIQVLDSYQNNTYADGQAASMYAQYPPLVNASRKPGEWQSYDIVFIKPEVDGGKVIRPAHVTVFHNGVLVHHDRAFLGDVRRGKQEIVYEPHDAEGPLMLQEHRKPVRYRNIWLRRLD
jgi:3-keto-disaccharide hydrolase